MSGAGLQSLLAAGSLESTNPTGPQPRLVHAAHEFEAQMMKELIKPMTSGCSLTGEDTDSDPESGSGGALTEFASEALGKALSERGGFGIAKSIVQDIAHSGKQAGTVPVTSRLHGNTVIKALK
jgi:Rod binding domain-containing protein